MNERTSQFRADFSPDAIAALYAYPRRSPVVVWALWLTLGWLGAHRLYTGRLVTGLLMLFTGGGGLVWWAVDALFVQRLVRHYNDEQRARERDGRPPIGLGFLPSLDDVVLERPPVWAARWAARDPLLRALRLAGDVLVVVIAGIALGTLVGSLEGAMEAVAAVVILAVVSAAGAGPSWGDDVPLLRQLVLWTHRVRLYYYRNGPASPPALLLRPVLGVLSAPFSAKARAEARLYMELGAAFTAAFFALDLFSDVLVPWLGAGPAPSVETVAGDWLAEGIITFLLIYAFTTPIGAVLTIHLLVSERNTVPRVLAVTALGAIAFGAAVAA